jgi:uracil-DNA glycosylase
MIVGENPSKNNDKIIQETDISMQCFHSNSVLDRSLKSAIEQVKTFEGAYMTDAFASAYEEDGKKIGLRDIRKNHPDYWQQIYTEAKDAFVRKINEGKGSRAIVALGNDAFRYIQEFLQLTTDISPRIIKFEVASVKNNLRIYRVDHPSPLNAKYHGLFVQQLQAIAEGLT